MTDAEIRGQLEGIFHEIFADDAIRLRDATTAADIDGWDSFNHISIVAAAEVRFGIKFKTAELETLRNVGEFVAIIRRETAARLN
jgi:acyl carrier protein